MNNIPNVFNVGCPMLYILYTFYMIILIRAVASFLERGSTWLRAEVSVKFLQKVLPSYYPKGGALIMYKVCNI